MSHVAANPNCAGETPCCAACSADTYCDCTPASGLDPDPLTVYAGLEWERIANVPPHMRACHRGRYFGAAIVREMLGAFGVKTCPDCYRYVGLADRTERPMRRKGSGWREAQPHDVRER